ncbi:carboxypeptidase B-like [Branchiostoma floridae x Branchiostoma japonicum]
MKVLLLLFTITVASAIKRFDGEQVLRIFPKDERQLQELVKLEMTEARLDFWKRPGGLSRPVDVRVPKDLLTHMKKLLGNTGIQYTVMIDDLQQLINNQTSTLKGDIFDEYNNYEELQNFAHEYPSLTTLFNIGSTYEGRDIKAIRVGAPGTNKVAVFLEGQIHSREWIVSATLLYNIKFLLEDYGLVEHITELMNKVDFYFVPVTNPDGYIYTMNHVSYRFICAKGGSSNYPCADTYHGPRAFSEVETQSLSEWVKAKGQNIKAYLAVHSYSQLWMSPYGWTSEVPKDYDDLQSLAKKAVSALAAVHGTKFDHGSIPRLLYIASGGSIDWAYNVAGIKYSYAIELRDTGRYGFILPADQIEPSAEEFYAALKVVAEHIAKEFST